MNSPEIDHVALMRLAMEIAIETGKRNTKRIILIYRALVAEMPDQT